MIKYLPLFLLTLPVWAQEVIENPPVELDNSRFVGEFFKMLLILSFMVIALLSLSWFVKRMSQRSFEKGNDENIVKVIERRALSPKSVIYVLDIEGRTVVVGETPNGITRLAEYASEEPIETGKTFKEQL